MDMIQENIKFWKGRRMLVHDTVYRVKIEASMGCNRDCDFCGMTRKESKLLTKELFGVILNKLPDTLKRIEYILHGEPTLNKNLMYFFERTKEKLPKTQIALGTNGWSL